MGTTGGSSSSDTRKALAIGAALVVFVAAGAVVYFATGGSSDANTYAIQSEAMLPTYGAGEKVSADLGAYDDAAPATGDVIVFHPSEGAVEDRCATPPAPRQACAEGVPKATHLPFVMRIVAGPGQTVSIAGGRAIVDGQEQAEDFIAPCHTDAPLCDLPVPVTVPEGQYFVLGDNRGASADSRIWGPVHADWIVGRIE